MLVMRTIPGNLAMVCVIHSIPRHALGVYESKNTHALHDESSNIAKRRLYADFVSCSQIMLCANTGLWWLQRLCFVLV